MEHIHTQTRKEQSQMMETPPGNHTFSLSGFDLLHTEMLVLQPIVMQELAMEIAQLPILLEVGS